MTLSFEAVEGIDEIQPGDDIADLIAAHTTVVDGDVVVVTSKIVSKAAGLATSRSMGELLARETDRVVASSGGTRIIRTHHGLTMAAAGIDNSNTMPGTLIPLPPDPDGSASAIRSRLYEITGVQVAVIVSDTAGRAWRVGQTDIAIGCAGLLPFDSYAGRSDPYGNQLTVTAPAIADQVAAGAELASGKFGGRPIVIVRGTMPAWHTEHNGPGARTLIRDESTDMFGLGAREAAVAAIIGEEPVRGLPLDKTVTLDDIIDLALTGLTLARSDLTIEDDAIVMFVEPDEQVSAGMLAQRLISLGIAHGIHVRVRANSN